MYILTMFGSIVWLIMYFLPNVKTNKTKLMYILMFGTDLSMGPKQWQPPKWSFNVANEENMFFQVLNFDPNEAAPTCHYIGLRETYRKAVYLMRKKHSFAVDRSFPIELNEGV